MDFQKRSIEESLKVFKTFSSKKLKEQKINHYLGGKAWSFSNLEKWPEEGPVNSLYLFDKKDIDIYDDYNRLVDFCNFQAVGTWNANGKGKAITILDKYQIVDVKLIQEQVEDENEDFYDFAYGGNYVNIIYATWVVDEGIAIAIWNSYQRDKLAKIIGITYPTSGWVDATVWHGE